MTHRRKRNTGTIVYREPNWVGIAPQHKRGEKQFVVARDKSKTIVESALAAWLNKPGRIVRRELGAEKRCRRKADMA
jgi:hypothetical protein